MLKLLYSYLKLPQWNNGGMGQIGGGCVFIKRIKKNWSDMRYERSHYFIKKENTQNIVIPHEQQNMSRLPAPRGPGVVGWLLPCPFREGRPILANSLVLGAILTHLHL